MSAALSAGAVGSASMAMRPGRRVAARQRQQVGRVGVRRPGPGSPAAGRSSPAALPRGRPAGNAVLPSAIIVSAAIASVVVAVAGQPHPPAGPQRPRRMLHGQERRARGQLGDNVHHVNFHQGWDRVVVPVVRARRRVGSRHPHSLSSDAAHCPPVPRCREGDARPLTLRAARSIHLERRKRVADRPSVHHCLAFRCDRSSRTRASAGGCSGRTGRDDRDAARRAGHCAGAALRLRWWCSARYSRRWPRWRACWAPTGWASPTSSCSAASPPCCPGT